MQLSTLALYGLAEIVVVLLVVCLVLLIHNRRKSIRISGLQDRIQGLLAKESSDQGSTQLREEQAITNAYLSYIEKQLQITREYHSQLNPDQDIALDLDPRCPGKRRTAAVRHALLIAEKEAISGGANGNPNWSFLESKFQQLIQFYVDLNVDPKNSSDKTPPPKVET